MASSDPQTTTISTQNCFFHRWLDLQNRDLSELIESLNLSDNDPVKNESLSRLIEKSVQNFQDYIDVRSRLSREQVSVFFAPNWCSSFEHALSWIGGCRPTMFIRLIYALSGSELESQLEEFLDGSGTSRTSTGTLAELSTSQLIRADDLHRKTIKEEEKLMSRLASLQEDVADEPLAMMAKRARNIDDELDDEMGKALDDHEKCMASVLEEADELRIRTLKEIIEILTPKQAVEFLATSKKLRLCVHAWGKKRDAKFNTNHQ